MAEGAPDLATKLEELRQDYIAQLPRKLLDIHTTWSGLAGAWDRNALAEIHRMVHSLAGSGKTFGFDEVSNCARTLERLLKAAVDSQIPPATDEMEKMNHAVDGLSRVIAGIAADIKTRRLVTVAPPAGVTTGAESKTVFLVEDDKALAHQLAAQLGHYGYSVRMFHRLEGLETAIREKPPAAVIADSYLPDGESTEVIGRLRIDLPGLPVILISGNAGIATRLMAVRAGAAAFFVKPLDAGVLIDRLDALVQPAAQEAYRVLIVEDTQVLADLYAAILRHAGMIVEIVNDPMQALPALERLMPDLILMDVYMPGCSGLELAAVIRQQQDYVSIPIVFLSTETDLYKKVSAMGLGADDFLTKPIEAEHLLQSVNTRAVRARILRGFILRDSLTGLLNHTATTERLDSEAARAGRQKTPLSVAMIDIDHFKSVNDSYGHPVGDQVLKSMVRLLQQRLRKSDIVGRYGGEEFTAILPDADAKVALQLLDRLRESFSQVVHEAAGQTFHVTFSTGIADYRPGETVAGLIERADAALYEAKHGGRNRIVLAK